MAMSYAEKAKIVMMLNKRMRDIINKTGFNTAEFAYWENKIDNLPTTTAYTKDDQEYHLLSRAKEAIMGYTDEQLRRLMDTTRTWSQVKANVVRSMKEQQKTEIDTVPDLKESDYLYHGLQPNLEEINQFLYIRKTINEWFDENDELVYALLELTGWDDIGAHSTREIYEQVRNIRETPKYKNKNYTDKQKDKLRAQYRARRRKAQARAALRG